MVQEYEISEIAAPKGLESFFNGKLPQLWSLGAPSILTRKLLGIISARRTDADLALKSSRLLEELTLVNELAFVGGWHSPLEKEVFRILSARGAQLVFCVAKTLNKVAVSAELDRRVSQRQVLLLTRCGPKAKRISRDASLRRNELVAGLAAALLVLSAPAESASLALARLVLDRGKPVLTPEHPINNDLLASGALPATLENVRATLV